MVKLFGVVYSGRGRFGDFAWMVLQPRFANALFVFNDNVADHATARRGRGNAVVRPYNRYGHLRHLTPWAAGIPTGQYRRGYARLSREARVEIDAAVREIRELLRAHDYDALYYSASAPTDQTLGTGLFIVSEEVRQYITARIHELGEFGGVLDR